MPQFDVALVPVWSRPKPCHVAGEGNRQFPPI